MYFIFQAIQEAVQTFWTFWSGLFEPLPYGDPYLAFAALFVVIAVTAKLIVGKETA
ncbi:MAG: hypothetical protein ACE5GT_06030 [Rhodospirillales bacterium]